ncbi:hypothetical protein QQX98_012948 [Neonectria punicea]|uniref:Uncharacterized protein n=1 Tax=Neonectria punicea TaxID=979145 RepID=A0ABR1GHT7_9HYPO
MRFALYDEAGLQGGRFLDDFIDPFSEFEKYGPLGDLSSFASLSTLSEKRQEERRRRVTHRSRDHYYEVSASEGKDSRPKRSSSDTFPITIRIRWVDEHYYDE